MKWDSIQEIKTRLAAEQGTIIKDWGGKLPVALIYPNSYHIGMSNLGIQAIYRFINNFPDAVCERVFYEPGESSPPPSTSFNSIPFNKVQGKQDRSLRASLAMESQRPLTDFAVLAFSVSYELDYFNIVRILKASGIPLYAQDRDETHPLVIAGGPCITANPMPLVPFFDCLCIGEAEALLPPLLPVLKEGASEDRTALLEHLAALPGIYVPRHTGKPVVRQWVPNLDEFPVHSTVLTRATELGDMYLIEVERGCNWGCRFCLVSNCFKPMRFRSVASLMEQGQEGLQYRRKLGLVGPAVTDHPQIEELVARLSGIGAEISVSSLRIKPLPATVLSDVVEGGGTRTVALAPEAGSQRLRDAIGKRIDEDDILKAVEKVARQGISHLKLYFMIGLPAETDDDILEITRLVDKCRIIMEKYQPSGRLVLTISPFIPKAGTPFQWQGMASLAVLKQRLSFLKHQLSPQGISIKNESIEWSEVQAVLSRGDEKLAEVLADMKQVSLAQWRRVIKQDNLDIDCYAHQMWDIKQELPWQGIEF